MASTPWIAKEPDIQTHLLALEQSKKEPRPQRTAEIPLHNSDDRQRDIHDPVPHKQYSVEQYKSNGRAKHANSGPVIIDSPGRSVLDKPYYHYSTQNRTPIDAYLRATLDAYYCAFRKIGDARAKVPQFDDLCSIHRDIWQQLSRSKNSELAGRIRDFRVQYENDMKIVRETETGAVPLMRRYVREECVQQWSPYTNALITKAIQCAQHLDRHLQKKEHTGMKTLSALTKQTKKGLMGETYAQNCIAFKFRELDIISNRLINRKYRRVVEERTPQMDHAWVLCTYVGNRYKKDTPELVDKLEKDVLVNLCNDILESYTAKAAHEYAPILQHIASYIHTQRVLALENVVSEQSLRLNPIHMTTNVYLDMKATKVRLDGIEKQQDDKETVDDVQTRAIALGEQVTQTMRKAKRLRQDQIMLSNARKKARLCKIERKVEQLEDTIDRAKQTVLSETFPMRTEQVVAEVYEVLSNHGEFIRRLVDPVAAKNEEQVDRTHLNTISTLRDGLTFPLRFSIERLAQSAAQDVLGNAVERLDILEKKLV